VLVLLDYILVFLFQIHSVGGIPLITLFIFGILVSFMDTVIHFRGRTFELFTLKNFIGYTVVIAVHLFT